MDIALALKQGDYKYGGSVTANTEKCYNEIRWNDKRPKPTWVELQVLSATAEQQLDADKADKEADKVALQELIAEQKAKKAQK